MSELEGLVGAKQRMTSKLMLKLLTQELEVSAWNLLQRVSSRRLGQGGPAAQ